MHLEFVRIEEANDLLNKLIENHPNAIFISNQDHKIEYFNKSFQKLADRKKHEILGKEFCETFGCIYNTNKIDAETNLCKRCRIREILSGGNISELDTVYDFVIHNKHVIKHLYFTTTRVVMNGKKLRIVNIEDRTSEH